MSKNKDFQNRLDKLLSDESLPQPKPAPGAQTSPPLEQIPVIPATESSPSAKIGWSDFLNAIDRSERIGYSFSGDKISTLSIASVAQLLDEEIVDVPLQVGDETVGSIHLEGDKTWTDDENRLVASIAQQVSQHIENLRLLEQAEQYRNEAEEASRQLTKQGWEEYLQTSTELSHGYSYDQNRVTPYNAETTSVDDAEIITQEISVREEEIGQLQIAAPQGQSEDISELLSTVADNLSTHIEGLRLLDETERGRQQLDKRAAELETVAKVSTAAAAIRDPESLLRSVVDLTSFSFSLYHVSVYLLKEDETGVKTLNLTAASGKTGYKMLEAKHIIPFDAKKSVIAQAARTEEPIIVADTTDSDIFLPYPLLPDTRSEMAIPMIVAEQLIGIFDVEANIPNRFSQDDVRTYNTLASQTAVALQNAQLYEEQVQTVERLRELEKLKSSFLANMSHELRTPLNSISGFTQVMLEGIDGELTEYMEDDLKLIEKNAKHLLTLINEMLDMAKIEAGKVTISIEQVELRALLEEIIKITQSLATTKGISLKLESDIPKEMMVMLDGMRIQQVMLNLIGNAVKFTEDGGVTIDASVSDEKITIRVIDTGLGIPSDKLEVVFEAFSQVETSTTRKVGGTGLGLPISRHLVEMHEGRLWAESSGIDGEGSAFIVELPLNLPEENRTEENL